jgi:hypothetical protein
VRTSTIGHEHHPIRAPRQPYRVSDEDNSGGIRGPDLNPERVQQETLLWLTDLDKVLPGALAAATRTGKSKFLAHLQHWPSDP